MAWVTPTNVATGDVLTASTWNQAVVNNTLAGLPSFTNEAARDAAVGTPSEGMACYLTAPTVPAATGGSTAVPSGVITVYNGSVWVCITPVGSFTNDSGTRNNAAYGALTGGGTNPSVTLVTGTTALVSFTSYMSVGGNTGAYTSFAVSGASTIASSDNYYTMVVMSGTTGIEGVWSRTHVITGLTAGTNTFTLEYRTFNGTQTFQRRSLTVQGIA